MSSQRALRRLQDRLAGAMQAASLAELSASIVHEVNQPLAAIVANAGGEPTGRGQAGHEAEGEQYP
ncbi:hypothetical protein [Aurantimonas sp. 22II-16-19i]|uniref:hypothetical protein n=1 Tax=Aurantimonas sp. 22II-16-19i TaxID=1317114 RepID=UPI0009F7A6E3|nr:hypothetical protein [Aurantimonas sp. 22II-16-19i]ORE90138.1 putative two-component sensor histidine kinase protein [Aurantimonas sp. 22II-16-19i]